MSLHDPYGFKYLGGKWANTAEAWYSIIHNVSHEDFKKGHYKTTDPHYNDTEKYDHLLGILKAKIETHPILEQFLLDTQDSPLVYSVSHFASQDQKFLGIDETENLGRNKLGTAWTEIRDQLQKQKQCQTINN